MLFTVYTDGACSGNKRDSNCPGGWAYIILDPANVELKFGSGNDKNTTNNRMEMTAVCEGLKSLKLELDQCYGSSKSHDCVIVTDSKYVSENFETYLPEWKRNGWRKSNGGSVINGDLWKRINSMTPEFKSIRFQWVKGHHKDPLNKRVDELAQAQSRSG